MWYCPILWETVFWVKVLRWNRLLWHVIVFSNQMVKTIILLISSFIDLVVHRNHYFVSISFSCHIFISSMFRSFCALSIHLYFGWLSVFIGILISKYLNEFYLSKFMSSTIRSYCIKFLCNSIMHLILSLFTIKPIFSLSYMRTLAVQKDLSLL